MNTEENQSSEIVSMGFQIIFSPVFLVCYIVGYPFYKLEKYMEKKNR
jgi:hypothetical protein